MEFQIENIKESINGLMRKIGYMPVYFQKKGEFSIIRKLGGNDYPRFHLYIRANSQSTRDPASCGPASCGHIFSLHLDQKKPSYEGSHAHSGEYDGEVVEREAERIKQLLL